MWGRSAGVGLGVALLLGTALSGHARAQSVVGLSRMGHIVVLYEENHSFDNFYGNFSGANGIAQAPSATMRQVDRNGQPYTTLPPALSTTTKQQDARIPTNLPDGPFRFNDYYSADEKTGEMIHAFYTEQQQIDGGKLDKLAAWGDSHGQVMGYWDIAGQPLLAAVMLSLGTAAFTLSRVVGRP